MRKLLLLIGIFFMSNVIAAQNFEVTSTSFKQGGKIPVQYTCTGKDISPQLSWKNAPAPTESFALICADPDAPVGVWYHWVMFNIPKNVSQIPENQLPQGVIGINSFGRMQYNGPCPPPGKPHHYIFTIYALNTQLNLPQGSDAETVKKAMEGHLIESAAVMGTFGR